MTTHKAAMEPSRRELYGGLIILAVLAGVAISRSAGPQQTLADAATTIPQTAAPAPTPGTPASRAGEEQPPTPSDAPTKR